MKSICGLLLFFILLSSCTKDENPRIVVKIEMNSSERLIQSQLYIRNFSLYSRGIGFTEIGGGLTQQLSGQAMLHDLNFKKTKLLTNGEHWEMEISGVRMDFSMIVVDDQKSHIVNMSLIDFIPSSEGITLRNNEAYEILISFDTDNAIVLDGGEYSLNWNFVTVTITKE